MHDADDERPTAAPAPSGASLIPILEVDDPEIAIAYYEGCLGFHLDWRHAGRLWSGETAGAPVHCQLSWRGVRLHLRQQAREPVPSSLIVEVPDVDAVHARLLAQEEPHGIVGSTPAVTEERWGRFLGLVDPFGNRLVFLEPHAPEQTGDLGSVAEPVVCDVVVPTDPLAAFDVFVDLGAWWDPAYSPDPDHWSGVLVDPHEGGRITFPLPTGDVVWANVLRWRPGHALVLEFSLGMPSGHPTVVSVDFAADPAGCRVVLAHGGWTAENVVVRERFTDWPHLLDRYAEAVGRLGPTGSGPGVSDAP